ncbi:common pilus major fimbrillin subunit EcpA, partial [Escherichia coli]|uniref:common pilus major fimbrillin subunit EcpA n=1 Tax=Escherichia coli TaxID=562 RepID=UPI003C2F3518
MKKKVLAIALVTVFTGMGVAQAADVTAQAVATWSATAKKDTTSKLVVTPLGSLAFQGNDSNLLIVFYVQIMPDDFVMQLHR